DGIVKTSLVILAVGATAAATVSLTVDRDRPPVEQMDVSPPTASFPSGHTGAAFTLYGILALIVFWNTRRTLPRILAVAGAVIIPVSVAVARLYRGMHYLSDVVVGAGLGIVCIFVVVALVDRAIAQSHLRGET
ncbi:MAG: phosphatase PAP2 family protein, partial [Acidimicrobiia bacterium]